MSLLPFRVACRSHKPELLICLKSVTSNSNKQLDFFEHQQLIRNSQVFISCRNKPQKFRRFLACFGQIGPLIERRCMRKTEVEGRTF